MGSVEIAELWIYPVKSCGGVPVDAVTLERRGFAGDRRWMIVDEARHFVTQRRDPALTPVSVDTRPDAIVLGAPKAGSFELPWSIDSGERIRVTVWSSTCDALVHGEGSRWFSALLGRAVRLVYMPDDVEREVDPEYGLPGDIVSFADGYPVLVVSRESLTDLSRRLGRPLEMQRFRPNLVVTGSEPYGEDSWQRILTPGAELRMAKLCGRCVLVTRDPQSGEASKEPLRTLASYRKRDGKVRFGVNATVERCGRLRIGERLTTV